MTKPLNLAIAGLGTVGCGTVDILQKHTAMLGQRCGKELRIVAVSARDKSKKRPVDLSGIEWANDPIALAHRPNVDCVVELMGGSEGAAKALVETALTNGKHVVTANKALIAHHGLALAKLAEANNAMLAFEAAVAGGIPVIKALRDGLAANQFTRVAGILNGTCNYILTRMWDEKLAFEEVLKDAQKLGYAEADPTFDVDGIDAAHKLAILASLAFGVAPEISKVHCEGIRQITLNHLTYAHELGYTIRLLGVAEYGKRGIAMRVHPCMVPLNSPFANVQGVLNAVSLHGDSVGSIFLEGPGAGAGPTASSVVADIMDVARGAYYLPLTLPADQLKTGTFSDGSGTVSEFFLNLTVLDKAGVLAGITENFKKHGISVRSLVQHARKPDEEVKVVLTTHATEEAAMQRSLKELSDNPHITKPPQMIRIEGP